MKRKSSDILLVQYNLDQHLHLLIAIGHKVIISDTQIKEDEYPDGTVSQMAEDIANGTGKPLWIIDITDDDLHKAGIAFNPNHSPEELLEQAERWFGNIDFLSSRNEFIDVQSMNSSTEEEQELESDENIVKAIVYTREMIIQRLERYGIGPTPRAIEIISQEIRNLFKSPITQNAWIDVFIEWNLPRLRAGALALQ